MEIKLFDLFRKGQNLQRTYRPSEFEVLNTSKHIYPFFLSLEKSDIYAYSARFMIKPDNIITLEEMIESHFQKKISKEKECLTNNGKVLHYYRFKEFHQTVVDIITNDNRFIKALCEEGLEPPAPNDVFPYCDFEAIGDLQGEMELWWNIYWSPFWVSLSNEGRKIYLECNHISNELADFLFLHY